MKKSISLSIFIFMVASILGSFRVEEKHCLELIAANIRSNDGVISYPSTLGQDCNTRTKLQLILFLVRITYIKIRRFKVEESKKICFDFIILRFSGNNVYERSIVIALYPIVCRSLSSRLGSSIRRCCEVAFTILYFEHWNKLFKRFLFI